MRSNVVISLFIIFAVVLAGWSLSGGPTSRQDEYNFEQADRYLLKAAKAETKAVRDRYGRILAEQAETVSQRDAEIRRLSGEVGRLKVFETSQRDYRNLKARVASASNDLGALQVALSQAQGELQNALSKAARIETAAGLVTTYQFVCCGSMEPMLDSNDLVFLLWDPPPVQVGDIVGVAGECNLTHRVTRKVDGRWKMKGDSRSQENTCSFTDEDVIFKVIGVARDIF